MIVLGIKSGEKCMQNTGENAYRGCSAESISQDKSAFMGSPHLHGRAGFRHEKEDSLPVLSDSHYEQDFLNEIG